MPRGRIFGPSNECTVSSAAVKYNQSHKPAISYESNRGKFGSSDAMRGGNAGTGRIHKRCRMFRFLNAELRLLCCCEIQLRFDGIA